MLLWHQRIEKFPENSLKVERRAHATCFVFFDMSFTGDSICKQRFPDYSPQARGGSRATSAAHIGVMPSLPPLLGPKWLAVDPANLPGQSKARKAPHLCPQLRASFLSRPVVSDSHNSRGEWCWGSHLALGSPHQGSPIPCGSPHLHTSHCWHPAARLLPRATSAGPCPAALS